MTLRFNSTKRLVTGLLKVLEYLILKKGGESLASFSRFKIRPGWIEVIVGCMFSGKTEELIRQLRRTQLAKQSFQVFKPQLDNRYSLDEVASHNRKTFPSTVVERSEQILAKTERNTAVVGVDEGQFFDEDLVTVANELARAGKRVIVAGLDTDWQGRPFGPMPGLMAVAEVVQKEYAICMVCGEPATRTQRLVSEGADILVGSDEMYEARCRTHFDPDLCFRLMKNQPKSSKPQEAEVNA